MEVKIILRGSKVLIQTKISSIFLRGIFKRNTLHVLLTIHISFDSKVLLRDRNPWHAPKFYYDYFGDPHDMKVLVEGIKGVVALSETEAFRKLGSRLTTTRVSQCAHHVYKSDEYWACMARYFTGTLHHQSGTCKMGPASDPGAVVDPELRVHGLKNLRVVDASIFPKVPGAHLYAPTLMVGEKAADMIKRSWQHEQQQQQSSSPTTTSSTTPRSQQSTSTTDESCTDHKYETASKKR